MPDPGSPRAPLEIIDPAWYGAHGQPHEAWARLRREAPAAWCEPPGMPALGAELSEEEARLVLQYLLSRAAERAGEGP